MVDRSESDQHGQGVAQVQHVPPIDGRLGLDRSDVLLRPALDRLIDRRSDLARRPPKQKEVDEAVLERGAATLDGLGDEDRIDPPHQRPQDEEVEVRPAGQHEHREREKPSPNPQTPHQQPLVGQRREKQVPDGPDHERQQAHRHVHAPDLPPGPPKSVVDDRFANDRPRLGGRGCRSRGVRFRRHGVFRAFEGPQTQLYDAVEFNTVPFWPGARKAAVSSSEIRAAGYKTAAATAILRFAEDR